MKTKLSILAVMFAGFTSIQQISAQSTVEIYTDAVGANVTLNSYPGTGTVSEVTSTFYSGAKSIEWVVGPKNTHMGFDFWPVKNLSASLAANYAVEFYFKSSSDSYSPKINLKCKFLDYINGAAAQWENVYTITSTQLICDGSWHKVSIPLSSFVDQGTWKNSTFYPAGNFVWTDINRFRIMTDQNNDLIGAVFYFDDIKITSQITTNIEVKADSRNKFTINPTLINDYAVFTTGEIEGKLKMFNTKGEVVYDFGYVKPHTTFSWNRLNTIPAGVYFCKFDEAPTQSIRLLLNR